MDHFNFWHRWIIGVGLYLATFGLVLALFSQSALMNPSHPWSSGRLQLS